VEVRGGAGAAVAVEDREVGDVARECELRARELRCQGAHAQALAWGSPGDDAVPILHAGSAVLRRGHTKANQKAATVLPGIAWHCRRWRQGRARTQGGGGGRVRHRRHAPKDVEVDVLCGPPATAPSQ